MAQLQFDAKKIIANEIFNFLNHAELRSKPISDYLIISLSWGTTTVKLRRGDGLQRVVDVTKGENKSGLYISCKDIAFSVIIALCATDFLFIVALRNEKQTPFCFFFRSFSNLLEIIGISEKSRSR